MPGVKPRALAFDFDGAGAAILLIGLALVLTAGLGGLYETTETRYAEIAREMRATGDWLLPRLNGITHLHKPPLAYWAAALGMETFGEDAAGARIPAVAAGLITLAGFAFAVRRRFAVDGVTSGLAVWLLGTFALFVGLARSLASDPFLTAAVALFWGFAPSVWAIAALGVGFMAKGPVVFIHTVLPVLIVALWARDRAPLKLLGPGRGWVLAGVIGVPWYLIVITRTPGLLRYFLVNQIWGRYTSTIHERGGPPWYFIGVLIAGALPWTPLFVAGVARAWRERARESWRLAFAWLFAPLVFLSFSGSKLPAYILPCFPPVALFAASGARSRAARGITGLLLVGLAVTGAIAGPAGLARLLALDPGHPIPLSAGLWIMLASFAVAGVAVLRERVTLAALAVLIAWSAALGALARYEGPLGSPRPAIRLLAAQTRPGEPVIEVQEFHAGVPFYLRSNVRLLDVPRETGFDEPARQAAVIVTADSLAPLVDRHGRVWLFGPPGAVHALAEPRGLHFTVLTHWRGSVIGFLAR
jgi:4-amino-4-deoxy-L-arabinose transferase-like glycosyltransferase